MSAQNRSAGAAKSKVLVVGIVNATVVVVGAASWTLAASQCHGYFSSA
jgi:hypothetical protein